MIFALWIVMLLTVFATAIGLRVRQRMTVLSRIEDRSRLHYITEAGAKKTIAAIRFDKERHPQQMDAESKAYRHHNQDVFEKITLPEGSARVSYELHPLEKKEKDLRFGVVDEESKINVNTSDRASLTRLFDLVTPLDEEEAKGLVEAIISWREIGETQLVGFGSDEYYTNLPYPYLNKHAPFEILDELLLVRGMNEEIYERIKPFITIYGDGLVNINTASEEVLFALGLEDPVIEKFLAARGGLDGEEATMDDHVFLAAYDVASEVQSLVSLDKEEVIQLSFLNGAGKIKTTSDYYLIQSFGQLDEGKEKLRIDCIYNARDNIIEYWNENN